MLYVQQWVVLPLEVRTKMREFFGIRRSTSTVVDGGVVKSDGSSEMDLQAVSVEAMQKLLKSNEKDFAKLFDLTVKHFSGEVVVEAEKLVETQVAIAVEEAKQVASEAEKIVESIAKKVVKLKKK